MKMMQPDVISHENQLQHFSEPSIFILDVFRTADHAGQIFIPHRYAVTSHTVKKPAQHYPDHRYLCLKLFGRIIMPDGFSYHTG